MQSLAALEQIIDEAGVSIAVVATPASAAQEVCDRLVAAGVTSILNFAPVPLQVPVGVDVRKVDLASELQILAFHEQRKQMSLHSGVATLPPVPAVASIVAASEATG